MPHPGRLSSVFLILVIAAASAGIDQGTKLIAKNHLAGTATIEVIGDFFILTYAENSGAFLSLGSRWPAWAKNVFLRILPIVILALIFLALLASHEIIPLQTLGFSLILGGGSSNVIDRILFEGRVIDFMNVGIGRIRTGIFNVADLWILIGALLVLIGTGLPNRAGTGDGKG